MKLRVLLLLLFISVVLPYPTIGAPPIELHIELKADSQITAGDQWTLTIFINGANEGDTVSAILLNGFKRLDRDLKLDEALTVKWEIGEDTITAAGQSLAIVDYQGIKETFILEVRPAPIIEIQALTSANNLIAYGEARGMLITLALDRWGNAPKEDTQLSVQIRYPDNTVSHQSLLFKGGMAWQWLNTMGNPGRVRIQFTAASGAIDSLEITQVPNVANRIIFSVTPRCVINDGRDQITLKAKVLDVAGWPVSNGTMVRFFWLGGEGWAATSNGEASIKIPAPTQSSLVTYSAISGPTAFGIALVRVRAEGCPP